MYGTNKSGDEGDSLEVVGFFVLKAKIELQCWFQFSDITIASSNKGKEKGNTSSSLKYQRRKVVSG